MGVSYGNSSGPMSDEYRFTLKMEGRARERGWWLADCSIQCDVWYDPAGKRHVVRDAHDLAALLEADRDSYWASEAARWRGA